MTMTIDTLDTTEYPTRYTAFDNPGQWVRYTGENPVLEMAVYHEPMQNARYGFDDGIYAEVRQYPDRRIRAECHATAPDASRDQKSWAQMLAIPHAGKETETFEQALALADSYVKQAQTWVKR